MFSPVALTAILSSARGLLKSVMSYLFNKPGRLGLGKTLDAASLKNLQLFEDFAVSGTG
jgi:hypothetical protein